MQWSRKTTASYTILPEIIECKEFVISKETCKNKSERRFLKEIYNLFDIYLPIVDGALVFDNSFGKHELIAQKIETENISIVDKEKFNQLKEFYNKKR